MEPHYTGERNSRYMCGIIYLMKITPKTNTPFQSKWATCNFTLATKGTWHQERDTCLGVSRRRYDCGETHNTPLHQDLRGSLKGSGALKALMTSRKREQALSFPTLNKSISGDDARTVGELPRGDSLSSFELHEFQPQICARAANNKYIFR